MTTENARVAILPRRVAAGVITTAVSRGAWGVSLVILVFTVPVLLDVLADRGLVAQAGLPLLALAVMLALLVLTGLRPSNATRLLYLVVGNACSFGYTAVLLDTDPSLNGEGSFLLNRPAMLLVLTGASIARPVAGLAWSSAGFATATAGAWLASALTGVDFVPGWGPVIALGVYAGAFLALAAIGAGEARRIPDLARLEQDTRRLAIEHQFEQRAAAIVHDTVLGDLTAVMNSSGTLDPRVRDRFRADIATLSDAAWLRESAGAAVATRQDAELRNALESLVSDFQWRGLTVDVTGDSDTVARLSSEAVVSLVAAVRACLDNVLEHAQTDSAELVVSTTADTVSVMVVDNGRGFEPQTVADDRLGLRSSVTDRIRAHGGSVRVWSTPGHGTSVLLSVPSAEPGEAVADEL